MGFIRQKRLLLLGAGAEQLAAIRAARELGLYVVAVDGSPKAPGLSAADQGICADIREVDVVAKIGREAAVDGVFCHAVDLPHVVASVAKLLKLPGLDPEVADRATNKFLRYRRFQEQGIPCPEFVLVDSVDEASRQAGHLGYPLVMKPMDSAGARGVRKVDGPGEVEAGFFWALRFSQEPCVLMEEYLNGDEISTESVIVDGRITTTGFADRNYVMKEKFAPYFIEDGHTLPTCLSSELRIHALTVAEDAIRALGLDWGVAKGDLILTESGPKVFEMAPRTSGGRFCADMVPLATGVNILKPLIQLAVGEQISNDDLRPKFHRAAAQRFLFPPEGKIVSISGIDQARALPGIYDVMLQDQFSVGGVISHVRHHGERVGHVIAHGDTRDEAVERVERAVRTIRVETDGLVGVGG